MLVADVSSRCVTGSYNNETFRENLENLSRLSGHFIHNFLSFRINNIEKSLLRGLDRTKMEPYMTLGDSIRIYHMINPS